MSPQKEQDLGQENAESVSRDAFDKLKQRAEARRRGYTIMTICIAAAVLVIFAAASVSLFLRINDVVVEGVSRYDDETIIEASGLEYGQNLYSIDKSEIEKSITSNCPYIKSVRVDRRMPDVIALIVVEEQPAYYFELYGEYFVLSESMRVLERTTSMTSLLLDYQQIIQLKTQTVKRAVVGEQIVFENEGYISYAQQMLSTFMSSELGSGISLVDFSNRFAIFFIYANRLRIDVGSIDNIYMKITIAGRIIEKLGAGDKGTINVENDPAYYIIGSYES